MLIMFLSCYGQILFRCDTQLNMWLCPYPFQVSVFPCFLVFVCPKLKKAYFKSGTPIEEEVKKEEEGDEEENEAE